MRGIKDEEKKKLIPLLLKAREKKYSDETILYIGGAIFNPKTEDIFTVIDKVDKLLDNSKSEESFVDDIKPLIEFVLDEE